MNSKKITFTILLFIGFIPANATVPQVEREALVSLYNSTNAPSWIDKANSLIAAPVTTTGTVFLAELTPLLI